MHTSLNCRELRRPVDFGEDRLRERGSLPATFYVLTRVIFSMTNDNCCLLYTSKMCIRDRIHREPCYSEGCDLVTLYITKGEKLISCLVNNVQMRDEAYILLYKKWTFFYLLLCLVKLLFCNLFHVSSFFIVLFGNFVYAL